MEAIKNIDFIAVDETNCYLISPEAIKMAPLVMSMKKTSP
jgi:hypothetical protein